MNFFYGFHSAQTPRPAPLWSLVILSARDRSATTGWIGCRRGPLGSIEFTKDEESRANEGTN